MVKELTKEIWIRGHMAIDEDGLACPPNSSHAKCWCLIGWIAYKLYPDYAKNQIVIEKIGIVIKNKYPNIYDDANIYKVISKFNDDPNVTWSMVKKVLQISGGLLRKRLRRAE